MTIAELRAVRALLTPASAWTRKGYAIDAAGKIVNARDESARAWCLQGAVDRVTGGFETRCPAISRVIGSDAWVTWQDARSHAEVLAMLDEALAIA